MSVSSQTEERPRTTGLGSFLKRVKIRNYKSIASCDVELRPFTLLVGRNGSGKSNFLDALRFVAEGLKTSPLDAMAARDRTSLLVHRTGSRPVATGFEIELELELPSGAFASFGFEIGAIQRRVGVVVLEFAKIFGSDDSPIAEYRTIKEEVTSLSIHDERIATPPPALFGGFYLAQVAGYSEFRELYNALVSMNFYNINPDRMRQFLPSQNSNVLDSDGGNVADVFHHVEAFDPATKSRISDYLRIIVPEINDVHCRDLGPIGTIVFEQFAQGANPAVEFYPSSMSDGTLRTLGILVAINQLADDGSPIRLVGIEEPETGLHPAAAGALMDALREASTETQVLVTTHGADLLDRYDPEDDHLLVVRMHEGKTQISGIDGASRQIIQEHLDTAGGLLRMDHLEPDLADLKRQESQPSSFDEGK